MAGTLRQGQSEFFHLPACQHGSDLRCRPSPTARLELLDTNTGLPAGPLYLLGVIPLIQQRPLPPSVTFRRGDGRTLHVRKATRAETDQKAIYDALGIDPAPGGVRKMIV